MHSSYQGSERRRRRMMVTRNSEYHLKDGVCVAVRDLRTGRWLTSHMAMNCKVSGGVRLGENGCAVPTCAEPLVGEALYFGDDGHELVTSRICSIERPGREMVDSYPAVEAS